MTTELASAVCIGRWGWRWECPECMRVGLKGYGEGVTKHETAERQARKHNVQRHSGIDQRGRHREVGIRALTAGSGWLAEDITNGGNIAVARFVDALIWGATNLEINDSVTFKFLGPL